MSFDVKKKKKKPSLCLSVCRGQKAPLSVFLFGCFLFFLTRKNSCFATQFFLMSQEEEEEGEER